MSIRFLLVDALNLIRRVYAAQPGDETPEKAEGARISCKQSLQRGLRETRPTHALVVFEGREPSWRHVLFRDYKVNHSPMPAPLEEALPAYREAFRSLGVSSFEMPKVEADDVIGTLATKVAEAGGEAVILSTDKIFLQLLSPQIGVRDHFKPADLGRDYIVERFGVAPEAFVDFLALTGDSTNAIAGVPGVGPKTAVNLLEEFGSLDAILAAAASDHEHGSLTTKMRDKLQDHAEDARLARSLVQLQTDLDLGLNLKELRYGG